MRRVTDIVAKALSVLLYPLFVPTYGIALFCWAYHTQVNPLSPIWSIIAIVGTFLLNWVTDADIVLSYVVKTIKRFTLESTPETPLLEMFDHEDELAFATTLLEKALAGHAEYEQLIDSHLKGWEADRIAYMDRIILEVALAEIIEFPEIAITVSLNEYIELAKEYSGDKNYMFINGILTEIMRDLKNEGKLFKAETLK